MYDILRLSLWMQQPRACTVRWELLCAVQVCDGRIRATSLRTFRRRTGASFHDHLDVDPSLISDGDVVSADKHAPRQVSTGEGQYEASCWLAHVANEVEVLEQDLGCRN